jgi:hypothetical protein
MTNPIIAITDGTTGETIQREMTDEEYAALIESGWTETSDEPATEEPAPVEEAQPSTDAG